jgi:hypothetical protein
MFHTRAWAASPLALALSSLLFLNTARSQTNDIAPGASSAIDAQISPELSALGERGALIAEARLQVLEILESQGSCGAWFRETDSNVANVFRSVHYELHKGASQIYVRVDDKGIPLYKHPWGASTIEYGGIGSIITINTNGPFFVRETNALKLNATGTPTWVLGMHLTTIGPYVGDTPEVRMTILLHELGHIVGRLPVDDGSWNGASSRNTDEVLQHCKSEIHLVAKKRTNGVLREKPRVARNR